MKPATILALATVLAVGGALRFRGLSDRNPGVGDDRSEFTLVAIGFHENSFDPWHPVRGTSGYHGIYNYRHKPLADLANAAGCAFFGPERGPSGMAGVAGLGVLVGLFALGARRHGRAAGLAAAALGAVSAIGIYYSTTAWTNVYAAFCLVLAVLCHSSAEERGSGALRVLAGLLYAGTILADDSAICLVPILVLVEGIYLFADWRKGEVRERIRRISFLYIGAALPFLLVEFGAIGGKLIVHGFEGGSYLLEFVHRKHAAVDQWSDRYAIGSGPGAVGEDILQHLSMLRASETWAVLSLAILGFAATARDLASRRWRFALLILAIFAGHRLATASVAAKLARITVTIHPFVLYFAARGLDVVARGVARLGGRARRFAPAAAAVLLVAVVAQNAILNRPYAQVNGGLAGVREELARRGIDRVSVGQGALCFWPVAPDVATGVSDYGTPAGKGTLAAQARAGYLHRVTYEPVLLLDPEDFDVERLEPVAVLDEFPVPLEVPVEDYGGTTWTPRPLAGFDARIGLRKVYLYDLTGHLRPGRPEGNWKTFTFDLSIGRFHRFRNIPRKSD
ncbi:MAG: glycosyltransferase family 39 protein [Planctomycetes bacterium]|nr:glycosyltransferase family 39 protein [Planctomycetota bacterium]